MAAAVFDGLYDGILSGGKCYLIHVLAEQQPVGR